MSACCFEFFWSPTLALSSQQPLVVILAGESLCLLAHNHILSAPTFGLHIELIQPCGDQSLE